MTVSVAIRHQQGSFALDAAFASNGRLTAIFGPSGCGKTTLVNIIAGLVRPAFAKVEVDGRTLVDTEKGVWLAAHRRHVGYVFQDARLFPHLKVSQNLNYGRWFARHRTHYAEPRAIIDLLGIEHLLDRKPHELSGGEKQRVALGRALLLSPELLLMDEPLASLDEARKHEVLPYIEMLRDEFRVPIIYVSHALEEVARLATDIVVLSKGKLLRTGPAEEIVQQLGHGIRDEGSEAGTLLDMKVASYDEASDLTLLQSAAGEARVPGRIASPKENVRLLIRARDVMIATARPKGLSALNIFAGTIAELKAEDRYSVIVVLRCGEASILARITRYSSQALHLKPGLKAYAVIKTMSVATPGKAPAAPL
jgi:molybdate transport system ATP-binding protein